MKLKLVVSLRKKSHGFSSVLNLVLISIKDVGEDVIDIIKLKLDDEDIERILEFRNNPYIKDRPFVKLLVAKTKNEFLAGKPMVLGWLHHSVGKMSHARKDRAYKDVVFGDAFPFGTDKKVQALFTGKGLYSKIFVKILWPYRAFTYRFPPGGLKGDDAVAGWASKRMETWLKKIGIELSSWEPTHVPVRDIIKALKAKILKYN
jgi:hypothetical protein